MKDTELLGKKIKQLRLSNDLSLRDLADRTKVSFSFISSIEKNRYHASRETIISLADALNGADKNELLLLAGFAPDEIPTFNSKIHDSESKDVGEMSFYGGPEAYTEDEIEVMEAALKAYREQKEKFLKQKK